MPLWFNQNNGYNPSAQQGNGYGSNAGNQRPQQNVRQAGLFGRAYRNRQMQQPAAPSGRQMQQQPMPAGRQMQQQPMPQSRQMQQPMPQGRQMQQPNMPQGPQMQQPTMFRGRQMQSAAPTNPQQPFPQGQPGANPPNFNIGAGQAQMPQSLPDGVRYEPLDANTMNLIKNLNISPETQGNATPTNPVQLPQPVPNPSQPLLQLPPTQPPPMREQSPQIGMLQNIERFIQNERNASIFYQHLSNSAPREDYRRVLDDIRRESFNHSRVYNDLYQKYKGEVFLPQENEIDTHVNFQEGVGWAIAEECKAIRELSGIYEHQQDEKDCRSISSVIYKKLSDLGMLQLINTNREIHFDGYR